MFAERAFNRTRRDGLIRLISCRL
ncbi:hypothetical protein FWK35_00038747 [Aphis craccivora]|uniref:Uncharacterized protein n=1 Tax=Aphis craccivora TaxID=307492 RepID=A0A6G0VWC8_APHCR|nr:hypothetical protein FWK35_00038747 [Aphis craccivora]